MDFIEAQAIIQSANQALDESYDTIAELRKAAQADSVVIQRLRREVDHWVGVVEDMKGQRAGDEFAAENYRLAALTGTMATEVEVLTRERDEFRAKLETLYGDDFFPHESGDECLSCERPASEDAFPYCSLCLARWQRDHAEGMADDLAAKLARTKQLAVSLTERPMR